MHLAPLLVLAAWFTVLSAKFGFLGSVVKEGYDNQHPRDQQARLEGSAKRALAAHLNGYENFPPFAAAMLFAFSTGVATDRVNALGTAYILARVAYNYLYISNKSTARSGAWTVGMLSTCALFVLAFLKLRA